MGGARNKRTVAVGALLGLFVFLLFLTTLKSHEKVRATNTIHHVTPLKSANLGIQDADLTGHSIMPKLGNETAKAELGRAAWKLLHTTMARFPDEPTKDESAALKAYIHLFQRLYPCGECAEHFRKIITKFPPQVSTRSNAAAWACHVHNEVNKSLDKPLFNCANIGDFYDCGCAEDEKDAKSSKKAKSKAKSADTAKKNEDEVDVASTADARIKKQKSVTTHDDEVAAPKLQIEEYGRGG